MSSSIISLLTLAGKQITLYLGTFTLVVGVIGGLLNIIVFLSLKTFRESSSAFYLTIMSIVNIGQLLTGLLSRIMNSGFGIDWTLASLFYCKFRLYCFNICASISMTCICLAIIDQYLATSSRAQWRQWCSMKIARRLVFIFVLIWIIHNIPYLIYFDHVISITTGQVTCTNTNNIFQQYTIYGTTLIIGKLLPISITFVFGLLAYHNVQQLGYRTAPLVRRELDKQLTVMILVLIVFAFFTNIPNTIAYILSAMPGLTQDPVVSAQIQFANLVTTYLVYIYFAGQLRVATAAIDASVYSVENNTTVSFFKRTNETVYNIWNTTAGSSSIYAVSGYYSGNYYPSGSAQIAFDGNLSTRACSYGACNSSFGALACGTQAGFYLTMNGGPKVLVAFYMSTSFEPTSRARDPMTITIEGSNLNGSTLILGSSWTLIYNGSAGFIINPGRAAWGTLQLIPNPLIAFASYRLLVTSKQGSDTCSSYGEVLFALR
ncbi:unnamed protein product [Adineta steineri]|uniref:G-protein coupled receptors family 1 profile domain-containing protein n=1 Tax=Adineta steineri TaxID=433720 RepID=A0A814H0Y5_9BILA|nr:unnamed protein product [Adineta steineri]CAF1104316.1 unnamed protein product [Adineta steineri]